MRVVSFTSVGPDRASGAPSLYSCASTSINERSESTKLGPSTTVQVKVVHSPSVVRPGRSGECDKSTRTGTTAIIISVYGIVVLLVDMIYVPFTLMLIFAASLSLPLTLQVYTPAWYSCNGGNAKVLV